MTQHGPVSNDPTIEIGNAICRALDIDPDPITSITLELTVGKPPQLTIRRNMCDSTSAFGADVIPVIAHYIIAEQTEEP